ncbi:hypothetical protein [Chitinophaga sp. CF418]|uniref:hypothetical protein n=1 Tax=Chitinophaga sp. CF418 TaxID=1855287 RepID=UPI00091C32B6|nr:hypothetical protein [Chitinophaga sp. CF418]SHN30763.1 hypothetical protein SAMN05216311_108346 [Chitinophaga sp. CF418]
MRFEISFTIGAFESAADAYALVMPHVKGHVNVIKCPGAFEAGELIQQVGDIPKLLASKDMDWFSVHEGEISEITQYPDMNSLAYWRDEGFATEIIRVIILNDQFFNIEGFIFAAAVRKFNFAMLFDSEKACWQREQFVANFALFGKSLDGRKLISHPHWTDKVGLTVDIRDNPGRHIQTHNMMLMAAPDLWFGPGAWGYFEETDVMAFEGALKKLIVAPGTVYFKLFDMHEEDYEAPEILKKQRRFRECTKMDEIEEKLNTLLPFPTVY